jgi:hypothetical protein
MEFDKAKTDQFVQNIDPKNNEDSSPISAENK